MHNQSINRLNQQIYHSTAKRCASLVMGLKCFQARGVHVQFVSDSSSIQAALGS